MLKLTFTLFGNNLMKLTALCSALMIGVVMLTACDKPAPATSETPPTTQTQTTPTPNAYLDYQVKVTRTLVAVTLAEDYHLTEEQAKCVLSNDGIANYLSVLEPHFKQILSEEDFKEADEFFASETGQKFSTIIDTQLDNILKGEENKSTDEQKAIFAEATAKPFFEKAEMHANQMSEEEALAFLQSMVDKEIARCNIKPDQARPSE